MSDKHGHQDAKPGKDTDDLSVLGFGGKARAATVDEMKPRHRLTGPKVADHGQIHRMTMPGGWIEGVRQAAAFGTSSFREFHPPEAPDAKLCFYYRGIPTEAAAGLAFKRVLDRGPHELQPEELTAISTTLDDKNKPDYFSVLKARVEPLNGKLVVIVEGRYLKHGQSGYFIYINADGSGRAVQEIYFQSPDVDFGRYLPLALESFASIEWK